MHKFDKIIHNFDSDYKFAYGLYNRAKDFSNKKAKAKQFKQAWNVALALPHDYPGKDDLMQEIKETAYKNGIDLDKVTGY